MSEYDRLKKQKREIQENSAYHDFEDWLHKIHVSNEKKDDLFGRTRYKFDYVQSNWGAWKAARGVSIQDLAIVMGTI